MQALRLEGIMKHYRQRSKAAADKGFRLKPIDLSVGEGEFFALLGPSGCGKTTLLKIIAGLLTPDSGKIYLGDQEITSLLPEKRGFGMVFQQPLLFPHMTVEENVAFGLKMRGVRKEERRRKAGEMLASVGLSGFESRHVSQLSGGQQQRVALARAILSKPRLLLLDEPFSALDPGLREEMRALLMRLHEALKMTIVFVTHDRDEAFLMADRIGVMKDGSILQAGRPQELYEHPNSPDVAFFLGVKNVIRGVIHGDWFVSNQLEMRVDDGKVFENQDGWLVIRPEILHLHTDGENAEHIPEHNLQQIPGIVDQVTFRQGFYHLEIKAGSHILSVTRQAGINPCPSVGQHVILSFNTRQLQFIPRQTKGGATNA